MSIEQLTLIERPCMQLPKELAGDALLAAGSLPVNSSVVVGAALRKRDGTFMHGYKPTGDETRRQLLLRASHARRWSEFFQNYQAAVSAHIFDAKAIIHYVLGIDTTVVHKAKSPKPLEYRPTHATGLEMGKGYKIVNHDEQNEHYGYGLDESSLVLSSFGNNQPLFVAPASELLEHRQGKHIAEIVM